MIITSATIDTERFAAHFDGAPVDRGVGPHLPGRGALPAVVGERPATTTATRSRPSATPSTSWRREGPGDVLVFLSGEREIRDTADALGRLRPAATPRSCRSTPGCRPPSSTGSSSPTRAGGSCSPPTWPRRRSPCPASATSSTPARPASPATTGGPRCSACRSSRSPRRRPTSGPAAAAGSAPGICIRLYAEDDFAARPRVHRARDPAHQPGVGHPADGGARPRRRRRLPVRRPARRPQHRRRRRPARGARRARPRRAGDAGGGSRRSAAAWPGCPSTPASGDGARGRPPRLRARGDGHRRRPVDPGPPRAARATRSRRRPRRHARFADAGSDFLAFLRAVGPPARASRRRCRRASSASCAGPSSSTTCGCGSGRTSTASSARSRPRRSASRRRTTQRGRRPTPIHQVAARRAAVAPRHAGRRAPASTSAPAAPASPSPPARRCPRSRRAWVMAAELVETNRLWARVAARIQPEWAERLGAHLVKRSYGEPRWDARAGRGHGRRAGDALRPARSWPPARSATAGSTRPAPGDLFIRHALVEGDWATPPRASWRRNRELRRRGPGPRGPGPAARPPRRRRRRCPTSTTPAIPADVTSARHFDRWWKRRARPAPRPARLHPSSCSLDPGRRRRSTRTTSPTSGAQGDLALPLTYAFDPGVDVRRRHRPRPAAASSTGCDRGRLRLAGPGAAGRAGHRPDPLAAQGAAPQLRARRRPRPGLPRAGRPGGRAAARALARELGRLTGEPFPRGAGSATGCPPTCACVPGGGRGRPPPGRRQGPRRRCRRSWPRAEAGLAVAARSFERDGLRSWDFGTLPREVDVTWAGFRRRAYPALVDEGDSVAVRVFPTPEEQQRAMWAGTRRLLLLTVPIPPGPPNGASPTTRSWRWPARPTGRSPTCSTTASCAVSTSCWPISVGRCGPTPGSPLCGRAWPTP